MTADAFGCNGKAYEKNERKIAHIIKNKKSYIFADGVVFVKLQGSSLVNFSKDLVNPTYATVLYGFSINIINSLPINYNRKD